MLLIGLTGSIATGKSTVSALLSRPPYSLPIIDADLLARKVVEPGTPGYASIIAHFGATTPDLLLPASPSSLSPHDNNSPGRPLDRAALGRRVFGDGEDRQRDRKVLNGIVHPAVRWAMVKEVLHYYVRGYWAVVLDIPLLFESGLDVFVGVVIVVAVRRPEVQMWRLRERDVHLSEQEARDRVRSQNDVMEKARRAEGRGAGRGAVVWNDMGRTHLQEEVKRCMESVKRDNPRWWGLVLLVVPVLAGFVGGWEVGRGWWARRKWEEEKGKEKAKL